MTYISLYC